ncbi:MAG: ABC transporter permease [Patescibacteria group bacterium]|nr:ABC transporter permease [Patescibacteria group bacterium]
MSAYIWALYAREVKRFQKIWFDTVASPVVSTLLYLLIFGVVTAGRSIEGVDYKAFVYAGLLGMVMVNSSFSNPMFALILSKNVGTIVDIQLAPISPARVGMAYAMAAFTRGIITVFIAGLITVWFIPGVGLDHPLILMAALVITGIEFGLFGVIFGLLLKNFESLTFLMTFVMQPMIFLAGVFYPISLLPKPWDFVSIFNPLHHNINLIRYGLVGYSDTAPLLSFAVIVVLSLVLFGAMNAVASRALRK